MDGDQTKGHGNMTDIYFDGRGVQQMRNRSMVACTQYSGDDLDTKAIHLSQQKMTKRQRTENKSMTVGA